MPNGRDKGKEKSAAARAGRGGPPEGKGRGGPPEGKGPKGPTGLDKEHEIVRVDPDTGEEEFQTVTQRQYRDDKMEDAGWTKVDEDEDEDEDLEEEVEEEDEAEEETGEEDEPEFTELEP